MELNTLLTELIAREGSDLHLVVGHPPVFRIRGELVRTENEPLDANAMHILLQPHLTEEQQDGLLAHRRDAEVLMRLDGRLLRGYVFRERGGIGATFRPVPQHVPILDDLYASETETGVLATLKALTDLPRGLVIIAGPTGSGKCTTAAAMIETINRTACKRIFVIDDVIDYEFVSRESLITQHVVGTDVDSIEQGALAAMNADLDVAYLGEIRSMEAMRLALGMAETGHLVFAVIHAEDTSEALERLIEVFPEPRDTIRRMLARNVAAVLGQRLLRRADRPGRVAVMEILLVTPRIRQLIADGETDMRLAIEAGRAQGMQTLDDAVLALYRAGIVNYDTAWATVRDHERLGPYAEPTAKS